MADDAPWEDYAPHDTTVSTDAPWEDYAAPQGFGQRESADWQKRNWQAQEIKQRGVNGQSYPSTLLQNAGNIAGRVGDLAGNAIGSAARTVNDNLIPQSVNDAASSAMQNIGSSEYGQDFKRGSEFLGQKYDKFAQDHPEAAADLNAIGDIAKVVPLAKPASAMVEGAGGLVSAGAKSMMPAMSPGVADIATSAVKAGLPLTVDQVAPNSLIGKGLSASKIIPFGGSNAPAFQEGLNKAVMKAAGMDSNVMTAPALQARGAELSNQFKSYTDNKIFPSAPIRTYVPDIIKNVPKNVADQLRAVTDPLLAEAKLGPISGDSLDRARIAANELIRSSDDYGTKQAAGKLQDSIVNTIVGQDPTKAGEYKKLLGDYKAYKTVEDTYAQSKAGNVDPTAFQQAVMKNYGKDKALIDTDMGKLAKAATTFGTKPTLPWKIGSGLLGLGEAAATIHSPELAIPAMATTRAIQYFINRNPAIVKAIMSKGVK